MRHTDEHIEQAAERYRLLAENLDPEVTHADDLSDLRAVAPAEATRQDAARLREASRRRGRTGGRGTTSPSLSGFPAKRLVSASAGTRSPKPGSGTTNRADAARTDRVSPGCLS